MERKSKQHLITDLRKQILAMQGYNTLSIQEDTYPKLSLLARAFPNQNFPLAGIHEFIALETEDTAASIGFINAILSALMEAGSPSIWISSSRHLFPPAMQRFALNPDQIIFIDLNSQKEMLWVLEEALKCENLSAVVAEIPELSFSQSRRLQLVIEKSKVPAFILRNNPQQINNTTCLARWQITHLPSLLPDGMPGVGQPAWSVNLLKIRNAQPNSFTVAWNGISFQYLNEEKEVSQPIRKLQAS
ncbi:ImuA family protein [Pedobacter mucosus]|uniref:ImuA family protein n=1 Tax=Pedobacter mucosus TaxID=2895286 RepID=UPI001EE3FAD7|nr:Error-prone repair protein ImuA [Pedobacter mucosus]UKT62297.1 Error-prone repair protein ImuA [Pedobacter mucosus]